MNIGRIVYLACRKSCVQAPAPHETRCGSEVPVLGTQEGQMFKVILWYKVSLGYGRPRLKKWGKMELGRSFVAEELVVQT